MKTEKREENESKAAEGNKPNIIQKIMGSQKAKIALSLVFIALVAGGLLYFQDINSKVYIEKSEISAPIISLSPSAAGILDKVYVKEGDFVQKNQRLAKVGESYIRSANKGLIVSVNNTPGQIVSAATPVIKMIDPQEFRVVGRIQEDKGLSDIKNGQKVFFTIDAFGDKKFEGIVDSIAYTARQGDIVFSISDKREEKEFEVSVWFDYYSYPEIKNGMSAKMWVYK